VAEHVGYPHAYAWHSGDWLYQRGKSRMVIEAAKRSLPVARRRISAPAALKLL
jgi:hypothetical protein